MPGMLICDSERWVSHSKLEQKRGQVYETSCSLRYLRVLCASDLCDCIDRYKRYGRRKSRSTCTWAWVGSKGGEECRAWSTSYTNLYQWTRYYACASETVCHHKSLSRRANDFWSGSANRLYSVCDQSTGGATAQWGRNGASSQRNGVPCYTAWSFYLDQYTLSCSHKDATISWWI